MQKKQKLLVIEDEIAIRQGLVDLLVFHGHEVDAAEDGEQGLRMALTGDYQLLLLDIMLPLLDGFSLCTSVKQAIPDQPIIMLTAKSSEEDIIEGLTLGADDYIAKPFSVRELVLRVEAVLKRTCQPASEPTTLKIGRSIEIDPLNRVERQGRDGAPPVHFTRREIDLLLYLQQHNNRPVPREELLEQVWGYHSAMAIETRTVDIHIAKLRRKIETDAKQPRYLITLRGEGYRLLPPDSNYQP